MSCACGRREEYGELCHLCYEQETRVENRNSYYCGNTVSRQAARQGRRTESTVMLEKDK